MDRPPGAGEAAGEDTGERGGEEAAERVAGGGRDRRQQRAG